MTINEITVHATHCFGETPLKLTKLKPVNFIFAPNGSGKTTISNALSKQPCDTESRSSWPIAPTEFTIRVFNESYRTSILTEHVDGIFTMGPESKEANEKIGELEDAKRRRRDDRRAWRSQIGSDTDADSLSGLLGTIETERTSTCGSIHAAFKEVEKPASEIIFKGFRTSKDKLLVEVLRRTEAAVDLADGLNWGLLQERARSLQGNQEPRPNLKPVPITSIISSSEIAATRRAPSHHGSGKFAELIERLGNAEWVSNGRPYVQPANGVCPFCQGEAPNSLEEELASYFEGGFDEALANSRATEKAVNARADKLLEFLSTLENQVENDPEVDAARISSSISKIRTATSLLLANLREKSEHPTRPVEVSDIKHLAEELVEIVEAENSSIHRHNQLVSNLREERNRLVEDGWSLFLSHPTVSGQTKKFKGIRDSKNAKIADLNRQLSESEEDDERDDEIIADLLGSISNTATVADRINSLLEAMGFLRFKLRVASEAAGGYQIVRDDGTVAVNTLSEGEKSFICFAYFWESLFGAVRASESPEEVVAVIDDPISSLDSDVLFMVAAFIRDAAKLAIEGKSNLRQLIVLTHNTQFHQEAAFSADRNHKGRRFFRLSKGLNGLTYLRDDGNLSQIRGSYALLWTSVVEAARIDEGSNLVRAGVFNIVRRIIEGYFKTVGNVKDYERPKSISPIEERTIYLFHIWANAGSHTIADDLDQTIDESGTLRFLSLFRLYFSLEGHEAHFDMMIKASGGADLLADGQIFDSPDL